LLNVLSNAVKFTPPGGVVRCVARREREEVVIDVVDTGIGMTAAEIERALTPFRQVDNSLARRHDGTGLGLPLVKTFIEMLGGALEIRSQAGHGTQVSLRLPIKGVEAAPASAYRESLLA
jgi:two-component system, cell cycle sensor histidine kinase PleC